MNTTIAERGGTRSQVSTAFCQIPFASHYNPLLIANRSWIIDKGRIFQKSSLIGLQKWGKNIQTAAYNGARTLLKSKGTDTTFGTFCHACKTAVFFIILWWKACQLGFADGWLLYASSNKIMYFVKVSKFQNEFLSSKIFQNLTRKIWRISALTSKKWSKQENKGILLC